MLESLLSMMGIIAGTEGINEGIKESMEIEETERYRNSEGVEYSETDIERIEAVSDVMSEVFTDEVISNWENFTIEERTAYLNEYYARAGETLGVNALGVYVDDLYAIHGVGTQGVNCGDGYLGIDIRLVADPSQLEQLLTTTTHEMRHQLQTDALNNPGAFPDIPQETLEQWAYEMNNYIDGSYDFEAYQNQEIERDARAFAEEVVVDYVTEINNDANSAYSVDSYEAAALVGHEDKDEKQLP